MEQKFTYPISEEFHAKLHAKQIPHKNVTVQYQSLAVEITIEFDELLATHVLPLRGDHTIDLDKTFYLPVKKEDGTYELTQMYNSYGHVDMNPIKAVRHTFNIKKMIVEKNNKHFQNIVNIDDIFETIIQHQESANIANAQAAQLEELRQKLYAEQIAKEEEEHKARRLAEDEEQKARDIIKAKIKAERMEWVSQYGSDRLKKGFEQGYTCNKLYMYERVKHDLGENAILDYDSKIDRKDRSCPSMEGLLEAERIAKINGITDVQIVWLPNGTEIEDYGEPCEAVEAKFHGYFVYITGYI